MLVKLTNDTKVLDDKMKSQIYGGGSDHVCYTCFGMCGDDDYIQVALDGNSEKVDYASAPNG